jgi:hypothetical protein
MENASGCRLKMGNHNLAENHGTFIKKLELTAALNLSTIVLAVTFFGFF